MRAYLGKSFLCFVIAVVPCEKIRHDDVRFCLIVKLDKLLLQFGKFFDEVNQKITAEQNEKCYKNHITKTITVFLAKNTVLTMFGVVQS